MGRTKELNKIPESTLKAAIFTSIPPELPPNCATDGTAGYISIIESNDRLQLTRPQPIESKLLVDKWWLPLPQWLVSIG